MDNAESAQPEGVVFPTDASGGRSSIALNQAVFADATRSIDPDLSAAIEHEPNWRGNYPRHVRRLLEIGMESAENTITISTDGLAGLRNRMRFRRAGVEGSIDDALGTVPGSFGTATVQGRAGGGPAALTVPYKGRVLEGDSLRRQLEDWVVRGITEPSFAEAIAMVVDNPAWLDLSDQSVAVLGAGSEMGPFAQLCQWGARVWALDLPRPQVWERVLSIARGGRGIVMLPVPLGHDLDGRVAGDVDLAALTEVAGANLITRAPEVHRWLSEIPGPLTVGNYVYADGGTHVRVSVAIDAVMTHLQASRRDLAFAFLATPTDVFSVPWDAVLDARRRHADRTAGRLERPVGLVSGGRLFEPHYARSAYADAQPPYGIADNLVVRQGPNYALAKRLQRWRATVAREQGVTASLNIAPPTRTRSVVKNRAFAAAYAGMSRFGLEVFDPAASNVLMAAMLVHDLRNPESSAKPGTALAHPLDLFVDGANPGGMWRCPYEPNSIMTAAALAGLFERRA